MTALLQPLRKAFLLLNHTVAAPLIRNGAGPLLSTRAAGSLLVLRATGRTTGQVREAPLGYAVVDGKVVVIAGYGRQAHWFRNAIAHPDVEVLLPGAVLAGHADEVTDPAERRATLRTLISSMGVVGTLTLGDVRKKTDAEVDLLAAGVPHPGDHTDRRPDRTLRPGWRRSASHDRALGPLDRGRDPGDPATHPH